MRIRLLILISLVPLSAAFTQRTDDLRDVFRRDIQHTADSLLAEGRKRVDTLFRHGDTSARLAVSTFRAHSDSLLDAAGDSLDEPGKNAVRGIALDMERSLGVAGVSDRTTIRLLLTKFEKELQSLLENRGICKGCTTPEDFQSEQERFGDDADSLSDYYSDSIATTAGKWAAGLDELASTLADSIDDQIQTLREEYADYLKDHGSRLEVEASYESHSYYRGRDNGVVEATFGPFVTYHHRSGLFAEGSVGWVSHKTSGPDDASLGGGYEFTLSSIVSGSVSYTHYWYSDSSNKPQSVTNQSIAGMIALDLDFLSTTLDLFYDFGGGGGSEFSTSLAVSKDMLLSEHVFGGSLKINPTATATWGDQNEKLRVRRAAKGKKTATVAVSGKPLSVFGMMSYELSLPVALEVRNFNIEPFITYVIPMNVLNGPTVLVKDPSTSNPFVDAGVTVTMTVR